MLLEPRACGHTHLDVEEGILIDSVGWSLSLQLEHQHPVIMT